MASFFPALRAPWPAGWRVLAVLALYVLYLPLSGYTVGDFGFDAGEYWELSLKFTQRGRFSLLGYDDPLRGYLGPLLILPARALCHFTGCSMLTGAQVLGAAWAALLFGVAIPALAAQLTGRPLAPARWLALVGLTFIFWRDYFNFTLSDMPALTLLVLALGALQRRHWVWAVAAGLLLAAAVNIRPIYVASLPGCVWLLFRSPAALGRDGLARAAAFLVGAALVLTPQWRINRHHFQRSTPLVVAGAPGARPLYLRQLTWGTAFQRYETSLIPDIPRSLVYADPAGQQALAQEPNGRFASYAHYLKFALQHPVATSLRYLRHLFNGLDIRFPTPYPKHLHPAGQEALRLLNYALLGLGTWLAAAAMWRGRRTRTGAVVQSAAAPVLLAVLLPCLLVLPTLVESRFLLPLHVLLLAAVATCWQPRAWWRELGTPARRAALLVLALGWLWGCWQLSEDTARHRRPPSEAPQ